MARPGSARFARPRRRVGLRRQPTQHPQTDPPRQGSVPTDRRRSGVARMTSPEPAVTVRPTQRPSGPAAGAEGAVTPKKTPQQSAHPPRSPSPKPSPHDSPLPSVRVRCLSQSWHHGSPGWSLTATPPDRQHLPGGPEPPTPRLGRYRRCQRRQHRPRVARPATNPPRSPLPRLAHRYLLPTSGPLCLKFRKNHS